MLYRTFFGRVSHKNGRLSVLRRRSLHVSLSSLGSWLRAGEAIGTAVLDVDGA